MFLIGVFPNSIDLVVLNSNSAVLWNSFCHINLISSKNLDLITPYMY